MKPEEKALIEAIADAIHSARDIALEDAAKTVLLCNVYPDNAIGERRTIAEAHNHALIIAAHAIRELKATFKPENVRVVVGGKTIVPFGSPGTLGIKQVDEDEGKGRE